MTDTEIIKQARQAIALVERATCAKPNNFTYRTVKALLAEVDRLAARVGKAKEPVRWRHKVRGTIYEEIGEAQLQTREYVGDDEYLVLYRGGDGKLWARPMGEFHDGRFERIVPLPPPHHRRPTMTNEQRAHQLAIELGLPEGSPERRLAATFAEIEREALERAAQWHEDENNRHLRMAQANSHRSYPDAAANHRATAHEHREYAEAIRALPPEPAASVTHSASCNISEKLSDVCSCGAEPAAPDPTKALARLFTSGIKTGNAGYLFVRQLARDNGLMDGDPLWQEPPPLTESGRAALRLAEGGG